MKNDYRKLELDILQAQKAADKYRNTEDGGTCNFDTVCVKLGRNTERKRKELAGFDWSVVPVDCGKYWTGWWFVFLNIPGQANRRTRMTEAAEKELRSLGWETRVYYAMD